MSKSRGGNVIGNLARKGRGRPRKVDLADVEAGRPGFDVLQRAEQFGLGQETMLRLLHCRNRPDPKDVAKYYRTDWFRGLTREALQYFGSCVLCERGRGMDMADKAKALVVHHRNYRHWFDESLSTDVTLLCNPCHGRYHRGRKS